MVPWGQFSRLSFLGSGTCPLGALQSSHPICTESQLPCRTVEVVPPDGPAQPLCRSLTQPSLRAVVGVGSGTPSQLWAGTTSSKRCIPGTLKEPPGVKGGCPKSTSFREEATCPSCFCSSGGQSATSAAQAPTGATASTATLFSVSHLTETCKGRMWGEG